MALASSATLRTYLSGWKIPRRHGSQRPNRGAQPSGSPPGEPTLGIDLVSRARADTKDRPDAQVCVAARYALKAALAPMSRGPLFESVSAATIELWTLVDALWARKRQAHCAVGYKG